MKNNLPSMLFVVFLLVGCSSKTYRQAGSDNFSIPYASGKAVVVIDAVAEQQGALGAINSGTMLVGFAQLKPGENQQQLYQSPEREFATYPGAVIPWYAGKAPYGLHAYLLDPGLYAVVRCIYEAPEADYCPAGYWTLNGNPVGMAFLEISAGEIINTGQLRVVRTRSFFNGSTYAVSINNNQSKAKKYIESNWPSLADKLQYKPLRFTY